MSIARYSEYRPSGVEWLGEVPAHWHVRRLKHICEVFPSNVDKKSVDGETPVQLCNYTDVYYNDVINADMDFMPATATPDQITRFTLRAGDTIITKDSETADDIAVSAFVPVDMPGVVCGYHLSMIRPRPEADGRFVKRLFDAAYTKSAVAVKANGLTRVGLGQYALDNLEVPFPSLDEQAVIVAFLDRETAKIDALVAEQERLMALLKEKRQAVISHAVTKGLNADALMKVSGIVGYAEIPAHWDLKPLKHIAKVENSGCYGTDPELGQHILPVATTAQIDPDGRFDVDSMPIRGFDDVEVKRYGCRNRDILIVKSSGSATNIITGKAGLVDELTPSFVFSNFLMRIRVDDAQASSDFIYILLRSHLTRQRVEQMCATTTYPNLKVSEYCSAPLPIPPLSEQTQIVDFVRTEARRLDELSVNTAHAVEILQERRGALISAAVTGQIDVRHLATADAA